MNSYLSDPDTYDLETSSEPDKRSIQDLSPPSRINRLTWQRKIALLFRIFSVICFDLYQCHRLIRSVHDLEGSLRMVSSFLTVSSLFSFLFTCLCLVLINLFGYVSVYELAYQFFNKDHLSLNLYREVSEKSRLEMMEEIENLAKKKQV